MRPPIPVLQDLILGNLPHFPDARFVTDTQLVLDPAQGTVLNINTLLEMLDDVPEPYHHEVIDHFVGALTRTIDSLSEEMAQLDRRQILGSVTRLIYPVDVLGEPHDPAPLARGLVTSWSLVNEDTLAVMPSDRLLAHVTEEEMDRAARKKIRAYARGLTVIHEWGGVLLTGGRQTTSVALYIDDCARAVHLDRCAHGYFVAVPDRRHCVIIPATEVDSLIPLLELVIGTHLHAEQPFCPYIYHWVDGEMSVLFSDLGLTPSPELLELHGPVDNWLPGADYFDDDDSAA